MGYGSEEKFSANALKPEEARLKGSALALQAAFADINIHKSRSVYYRSCELKDLICNLTLLVNFLNFGRSRLTIGRVCSQLLQTR
jgi:hypothetical protein